MWNVCKTKREKKIIEEAKKLHGSQREQHEQDYGNAVFQNIKTRSREPQKDNGADQESKLEGRESIIFQCDKYKKVKKVFWWDGCKIKMDTPFEIFNHSNWLQYLPMHFIFNALFVVNEIHTRMTYYLENIKKKEKETTEEPVAAMKLSRF